MARHLVFERRARYTRRKGHYTEEAEFIDFWRVVDRKEASGCDCLRSMTEDNNLLDKFHLDDITPRRLKFPSTSMEVAPERVWS